MKKYMLLKEMWSTFETGNFLGEAAEEWAVESLNLTAAPTNQKGFDAWDCNNKRVQIKARCIERVKIDGVHHEDAFDYMVVVLHDREKFIGYMVIEADEYYDNAKTNSRGWYWDVPVARKDNYVRVLQA